MKKVIIYKLEEDGTQSSLVICNLSEEGLISFEGNENLIDELRTVGIRNYDQGKPTLFPEDGVFFLEQLKYAFRSGYLMASEVQF